MFQLPHALFPQFLSGDSPFTGVIVLNFAVNGGIGDRMFDWEWIKS
jgi:hypothetical protein